MSRSNGAPQASGQGQQWPETDAYGRPVDPRWVQHAQAQAQHPQQGYAPPAYPQHPGQAYDQYGQPVQPAQHGYGYPQHPQAHGEPAPGYHSEYPTAPPQHGYAPQHDAHAMHQAQQAAHHQGYGQQTHHLQAPQQDPFAAHPGHHQGYAQPGSHAPFDTQLHIDPQLATHAHAQQGHGYAQDPQAYGHDQYPHHGHGQHAAASDPRGWDLGQYSTPGQAPAHQPAYESHHPGHAYAQPQSHDPAWQQQAGWHGQQAPQHADPYAGQPVAGHPGFAPSHDGYDQPEAEPEIEEEAPRRGPSAMLVIGGLVGAIALGGGLAFAYSKFGGTPKAAVAKPPVVKADTSPTKVKPAEPGGKQQPNIDKVFNNRLGEPPPQQVAAQPAPAAGDAEVPRKVTTVIVNRDGSITPTVSQPAAPMPAPGPAPAIPGMVVQGGPPAPATPDLRGAAPVERAPPVQPVQKAQPQPRVAELPLPKVQAERPAPAPVKKKPAVRDDLIAPQDGAAPAKAVAQPSSGGANGYVAVLTSRQTREDALKQFADLHQKFPDILSGRTPDVREKDFGDAATGPKGVWYRLIVGPPGSKEATQDLCKRLSAQGMKGCFSMAY